VDEFVRRFPVPPDGLRPPFVRACESRLRRTALFLGEGRLYPPFCWRLLWVYSGTPSVAVVSAYPLPDFPGRSLLLYISTPQTM